MKSGTYVLLKGELKSLVGRRFGRFFLLFTVFFVTLFAMGVGQGVLQFLQKKMDNPYVQSVAINVPIKYNNQLKSDIERFFGGKNTPDSLVEKYKIESLTHVYSQARLFSSMGSQTLPTSARFAILQEESGIMRCLEAAKGRFVSDESEYFADKEAQRHQHGVIVSEQLAQRLGLEALKATGHVLLHESKDDSGFAIPVLAIVESLPMEYELLMTEELFRYARTMGNLTPFDLNLHPITSPIKRQQSFVVLLDAEDKKEADQLTRMGFEILESPSFVPGQKYAVPRPSDPLNQSFKELGLQEVPFLVPTPKFRDETLGDVDFYFVFFSELDFIEDYKDFLKENPNLYLNIPKSNSDAEYLKIELSDLEAKKHLNVFQKLVKSLSAWLLLLGASLVVIFTLSVLTSHLELNSANIGTLQAFGVKPKDVRVLYILASVVIITGPFVLATLLLIVGGNTLVHVLLNLLGVADAESISFVFPAFWQMLIMFVLIPITAAGQSISRMLQRTPGDLIFKR